MVVIWMLLLLLLWANLCQHINKKRWAAINSVIFGLSAATILYATILTRTPGVPEAVLAPFASLTAARQQPELYRAMLMNVFLFFPLGLTLSNALPQKWHRWGRIILTTFVGCALSAGIEYAQYRCALGLAETDDVICNTLGAFIGSTSLLIAHAIEKHKERAWHTNMTLTTTETQFLYIAKSAISGGDLPAENVDWRHLRTGQPAEAAADPLRGCPRNACRRGKRCAVRCDQATGHWAGVEPNRALGGVFRPLS